jgi:hypothetical protein
MAAEAVAEAPPTVEAPAAAPAPAAPEAPAKEPEAGGGAKAKKAEKAEKPKKDKKDKKDGKGKASKGAEPDGDGPSIAAHPRAARGVARAKSWGGLVGFVLGGYLSLPTNTVAEAGLRALMAGVACYVATWAGAVFLWRRLVMLEIKAREQQLFGGVTAKAGAQRRELPAPAGERPGRRAAS